MSHGTRLQLTGVSIETSLIGRRDIVKGLKNLSLSRKQRKALERFFFKTQKNKINYSFSVPEVFGFTITDSSWIHPATSKHCSWAGKKSFLGVIQGKMPEMIQPSVAQSQSC